MRPQERRDSAPHYPGAAGKAGLETQRNSETSDQDPLDALGWKVVVNGVVDGDTIEVGVPLGGSGKVRLIGIDAPEKGGSRAQPFGETAHLFSVVALREDEVALEFDRRRTDPRGGLFAYVYLPDGAMLNELILREGYAQTAPRPPNVLYADRLRAAQDEARDADRGLWGLADEELCLLANRGNGVGAGSPGCGSGTSPPED